MSDSTRRPPQGPAASAINSLTPYDVLGYLLPGIAFVLCGYAFELAAFEESKPSEYALISAAIGRLSSLPNGTPSELAVLGASVAVLYLLGHVISAISSFVIDRLLVVRIYGYPFETLLYPKHRRQFDSNSAKFWMFFFFWLNAYLLARATAVAMAGSEHTPWLDRSASWIGIGFTALVGWKFFFRELRQRLPEGTRKYNFVYNCMETGPFLWLSLPYRWLSVGLSGFIKTQRGFDDELVDAFHDCFRSRFGFSKPWEIRTTTESRVGLFTNIYWFSYFWVRAHAPTMYADLANWQRLYSFARNMSTALYGSFLYSLCLATVEASRLSATSATARLIPAALACFAVFMLVRYYYLYHSYYSKYLYRAFVFSASSAAQQAQEMVSTD